MKINQPDARRIRQRGWLCLAIVITACLLPALAAADDSQQPVTPRTAELLRTGGGPVRIVCFGDSVTGVYYHTGSRRAYTDMLGIGIERVFPQADVTMVNAGISGHTTHDALARIDRDVLAHEPTLVTVMFGLNDMTRVSLEEYRTNLKTIIDKVRGVGAEVVLCTPNAVIDTTDRPTTRLMEYCDVVRAVGRETGVPVCDCYQAGDEWRERDALGWRLSMSDEIHPNMDGHQHIAELLTEAITGRQVSLADVGPPVPALPHSLQLLKEGEPLKVLAMTPLDEMVVPAVTQIFPDARLEVTAWDTDSKSLTELMQSAQQTVRSMQPDLVVLCIPRAALPADEEELIHAYSWTMNYSLAFGPGGWDCLVIEADVVDPLPQPAESDVLTSQLVGAQDLPRIVREPGDESTAMEILSRWLARQLQ